MCSRHSSRHSSASKTSSTTTRLQALAKAKAAREEAQYTRLIAQKELEYRTRSRSAENSTTEDSAIRKDHNSRRTQKGRDGER